MPTTANRGTTIMPFRTWRTASRWCSKRSRRTRWATNRVTQGKVILGNLDGIEAGVRQMLRKAPLEIAEVELPSADQAGDVDGVASQLARQLCDPHPADRRVIGQLPSYRRLRQQWKDWDAVTSILGKVSAGMVGR
jgi:hypothetical protein